MVTLTITHFKATTTFMIQNQPQITSTLLHSLSLAFYITTMVTLPMAMEVDMVAITNLSSSTESGTIHLQLLRKYP